jgi:acyl carrier protein
MDSLDQTELVMQIEEECNCMIERALIEELEARPKRTLKEMAEFIARNI